MRSTFNVVLFGEAGTGKSSLINLMAGRSIAETSPDAWGCTLESKKYTFQVARRSFNVWDTVGLGEPMFGVSTYLNTIERAYALIKQITDRSKLDLLLFCIHGSRITPTILWNYRLFFEVLCEKRCPIALVVTHLEHETRMEDWWDRNMRSITQDYKLRFTGHACTTGLPGDPKAAEGRAALERLFLSYDHKGQYTMPPASNWYLDFLKRLTGNSILSRPRGWNNK